MQSWEMSAYCSFPHQQKVGFLGRMKHVTHQGHNIHVILVRDKDHLLLSCVKPSEDPRPALGMAQPGNMGPFPPPLLKAFWPLAMRYSDHGNSGVDLPGIGNVLIVAGALGWCAAAGVVHVYLTCAGSSPSNTLLNMAEDLDGGQQQLSSPLIPDMPGRGTENNIRVLIHSLLKI